MALLNVTELSERLCIKRSTLYAWAEQGMIPHVKLGRLLRFDPDEIEAWLQNHRRERIPEPALPRHRHETDNVDVLIAEAKRAVYTSCRETRPRQGQPRR
jgi:excisionase family DNA binding protein